MTDLVLATNNSGKRGELAAWLATHGLASLRLWTPAELGLELQPEESGTSYAENAMIKARAFAQASGRPALADDSGLEVAALGGAPGLHSARYAPQPDANDADRRQHLLAELAAHPAPWPARFVATLCLALPDGRQGFAAGECAGEISPAPRGAGGFGYDPIFIVAGSGGRSMAELSLEEKNQLSHRARALQALLPHLRQL
ncbi:MAG: RdgB/HAM1 family non-canonical purine NTP pyrophosphatase [Anaerolineales bacterium]|jgi:XTP/dITP diphosphohydrolase|nr:RdgB/HAM1 family non-canonical purine NTP pyrophosphatase [Anaerolineales bacterium]MBX3006098.1 RdgB/HAM1 family non-canonical purine NTP pyrophosphatase [Anaerolineales bacterium]MCW5838728.1 RdgB/HAM1 family non-canonical purine NTP pyrophosphatase [Anaerolineales bacterium]